jgi:hypothetical protein
MAEKKVQFIPFNAINAFMLPEFRMEVVRQVLASLPSASAATQARFTRFFKNLVRVPGFRNASQAPLPLKIKPFISVFEKEPEVAAATISLWVELKPELRNQVYEFLKSKGWEVLPPDVDRTHLPGFLVTWPPGEDFESLGKGFREIHPELEVSSDDISLMAVWLAGRLPYQTDHDE